jgi:hypothetical protein
MLICGSSISSLAKLQLAGHDIESCGNVLRKQQLALEAEVGAGATAI